MNSADKVATSLPLTELWDVNGALNAVKIQESLAADEIKEILRHGSVRFVIANVGQPLRWIDKGDCFGFWKSEVRDHLYHESKLYLADYPGRYFYFASEWQVGQREKIILLEIQH